MSRQRTLRQRTPLAREYTATGADAALLMAMSSRWWRQAKWRSRRREGCTASRLGAKDRRQDAGQRGDYAQCASLARKSCLYKAQTRVSISWVLGLTPSSCHSPQAIHLLAPALRGGGFAWWCAAPLRPGGSPRPMLVVMQEAAARGRSLKSQLIRS